VGCTHHQPTLISDITLVPADDRDTVTIGVRWHTGATDQITVERPGHGKTPQAAIDLVRRLGATTRDPELARLLNEAGLKTGKGRAFTPAGVARVRAYYQIRAPRSVPLQEGEISVPEVARRLGVARSAIYYWLKHDLLPGRRGPSGRWRIPWNSETEAAYRKQATESIRLKPRHSTVSGAARKSS
jgi:transposase-like protein